MIKQYFVVFNVKYLQGAGYIENALTSHLAHPCLECLL